MPPRKKDQVKLDGNLNIQKVESLYSELLKTVDGKNNVQLDFSEVTDIDFAALQLLYSFNKSCLDNGRSMEIVNIASPVRNRFELCDFSSLIEK